MERVREEERKKEKERRINVSHAGEEVSSEIVDDV